MVKPKHSHSEKSDAQRIKNFLTEIRGRMYRQTLLHTVTFTCFCGIALLSTLFLLNRILLLPMRLLNISWIVMSTAVIVGICFSVKHRKDLSFVARVIDEKMNLSERLSTALGTIQTNPQSEFAQLQIREAADATISLDGAKVSPYHIPKYLKFFPIPLLLIGISFTISPFYEVQRPLTEPQQQVLDSAIQRFEGVQVKDSALQTQLADMVKGLKTATDHDTAQKHISRLKKEIRKQQSEQTAIAEATKVSQRFPGSDADQLATELENITKHAEIPPELQEELMNLFGRLAESLPKGDLSDSLNQVQSKAITPETLQDIIAAFKKIEKSTDLAQLEAQLAASQKELALATIETESQGSGIANSDGAPGHDAGTSEVQGTHEDTSNSNPQLESQIIESGKTESETDGENLTPLTGDETPAFQVNGRQLTLTTNVSGNAEGFSRVFTGEMHSDAPPYLPFTDAVLNASRAYAKGIENNRIPVRYQTQIKSYLKAISTKNEKEHN